jgi:hypothetical protein
LPDKNSLPPPGASGHEAARPVRAPPAVSPVPPRRVVVASGSAALPAGAGAAPARRRFPRRFAAGAARAPPRWGAVVPPPSVVGGGAVSSPSLSLGREKQQATRSARFQSLANFDYLATFRASKTHPGETACP